MKKEEEPQFLDPNDFALKIMSKTKTQVITALDYRIKTLMDYNPAKMADTIDELHRLRTFVKGILYEKDSYKECL